MAHLQCSEIKVIPKNSKFNSKYSSALFHEHAPEFCFCFSMHGFEFCDATVNKELSSTTSPVRTAVHSKTSLKHWCWCWHHVRGAPNPFFHFLSTSTKTGKDLGKATNIILSSCSPEHQSVVYRIVLLRGTTPIGGTLSSELATT